MDRRGSDTTRATQRSGCTRCYNDIGQLDTLTAPGSKVWDYTYDTGNRLTRVDIPNGMHTAYTYDASGRQDSIHHKDGATVKQGFDYTFDDGGNITRIDHEDGSYWAYDYDGRDRLIEAIRGNAVSPTILANYEYTYDDGDNMLTKTVPWYDDFEDGNKTGWSGHTSNYSVVNGELLFFPGTCRKMGVGSVGANGQFEIEGVSAGKYLLSIWSMDEFNQDTFATRGLAECSLEVPKGRSIIDLGQVKLIPEISSTVAYGE